MLPCGLGFTTCLFRTEVGTRGIMEDMGLIGIKCLLEQNSQANYICHSRLKSLGLFSRSIHRHDV